MISGRVLNLYNKVLPLCFAGSVTFDCSVVNFYSFLSLSNVSFQKKFK